MVPNMTVHPCKVWCLEYRMLLNMSGTVSEVGPQCGKIQRQSTSSFYYQHSEWPEVFLARRHSKRICLSRHQEVPNKDSGKCCIWSSSIGWPEQHRLKHECSKDCRDGLSILQSEISLSILPPKDTRKLSFWKGSVPF